MLPGCCLKLHSGLRHQVFDTARIPQCGQRLDDLTQCHGHRGFRRATLSALWRLSSCLSSSGLSGDSRRVKRDQREKNGKGDKLPHAVYFNKLFKIPHDEESLFARADNCLSKQGHTLSRKNRRHTWPLMQQGDRSGVFGCDHGCPGCVRKSFTTFFRASSRHLQQTFCFWHTLPARISRRCSTRRSGERFRPQQLRAVLFSRMIVVSSRAGTFARYCPRSSNS